MIFVASDILLCASVVCCELDFFGNVQFLHFVLQVLGAAFTATKTGKHPGQLKDDVTSPGLERGGFRGLLMNAVVAATKRS